MVRSLISNDLTSPEQEKGSSMDLSDPEVSDKLAASQYRYEDAELIRQLTTQADQLIREKEDEYTTDVWELMKEGYTPREIFVFLEEFFPAKEKKDVQNAIKRIRRLLQAKNDVLNFKDQLS
ncbi:MAG: hypothetical protein HRT61_24880 [Ekhidna sp.]|nr:hypothetical protein [Ekhidna sp.]